MHIKEHNSKFWLDICTCKFVAVGEPMDNEECKIHVKEKYSCDQCSCTNYRPRKEADGPSGKWPRCTCGHCAQDHN